MKSKILCSFCSKPADTDLCLIAGPNVYICEVCIDECNVAIKDHHKKKQTKKTTFHTPVEIKEFLDQYIIGQDSAKEILSVAVYNHYKRIENPIINGVEISKANILLCGKSGVGKTMLVQTIARLLDVPLVIVDATGITEAGYVGEDVEGIMTKLLQKANNVVKDAERGIVFIDELDKKATKQVGGAATGRDISGEGVQQGLLKLLEGNEVSVPMGRKNPNSEAIKINTKDVLFIVGGVFDGIEKIIERSLESSNASIGFNGTLKIKSNSDILHKAESDHFRSFGLIQELIGRLPIIAILDDLSEEQLVRVLKEPKNSLIQQFQALFSLDDIELEFEDDALLEIAKIAKRKKTNGRSLRGVLEKLLLKTQFRLPNLSKDGVIKIIITKETLKGMEPELIYAERLENLG